MPIEVLNATEFIIRGPGDVLTLDVVRERAATVPGKMLAWCWYREGKDAVVHVAVNAGSVYEPHFRSTYRGQATGRPCLVLCFGEGETGEDFLTKLAQGGVTVTYSYSRVADDDYVYIAAQTSDNARAIALLDNLA